MEGAIEIQLFRTLYCTHINTLSISFNRKNVQHRIWKDEK